MQLMPGDTCDRTCACPHTSKILGTSENSPMLISLSAMQSHMLNDVFVVATAALLSSSFAFVTLLYPVSPQVRFDMLKQQDTFYFGYTNL